MSSISFEYSGEKLILCYASAMGIDDITKKLSGGDCVPIKHTFYVTKDLLCEDLNKEQIQDFELIKRQYKHIADIMTYDDLLFRLDNIVTSLKQKINV